MQEGLTDELVELAAGLRGHALQMQRSVAESSLVLDSIEARACEAHVTGPPEQQQQQ